MINLINLGGKTVAMRADGSTPYKFKAMFGIDLIKTIHDLDADSCEMTDILNKLAFCMAKQAENPHANLSTIGESEFVDWLAGFGSMDITNAATAILNVYSEQEKESSAAKKN